MFQTGLEKELSEKEFNLAKDEEVVFAEISERPISGRTGNVLLCESSCPYQIVLRLPKSQNIKNIELSDIFVGISSVTNDFYVKSGSLNKKLYIRCNHMLNPSFGSNAFRFLREIFSMKVFPIYEALSLFNNTDRIYTPRIIYNKVIITPATWSIPYAVFEEGIKSVQCFFETWEIPQYVYLIKGDNKLLLCLNNSSHVELLFYIAHGRKTNIKITEAFVEDEKNWLKDCNGKSYQNELVLFLFKNEKRNKIEFNDLPSPLKQKTDVQDINGDTNSSFNTIFPGTDGWIYLLLYYNEEEFEYILV